MTVPWVSSTWNVGVVLNPEVVVVPRQHQEQFDADRDQVTQQNHVSSYFHLSTLMNHALLSPRNIVSTKAIENIVRNIAKAVQLM